MKPTQILLSASLGAVFGAAGTAMAAYNCTDWARQRDDSEWRLCIKDSAGQRYCPGWRGSSISAVNCT